MIDIQHADEAIPSTGLEIMIQGTWLPIDLRTWRSWTGRRAMWGREYHGPVFVLDSGDTHWSGKRICTCSDCQSTVSPELRPN